LRHRIFHFALGGVFDGFFGSVRSVFDELGHFHGVPEEYRSHLRHVVNGSGAAAQVAAVHICETGFASGANLQRKAHVTGADAFNISALLNHGQ
jgi:hypothetical protein